MPNKKAGLVPRVCSVCKRRDGLLRCSGCRVVYYCGQAHQASDRERHKKSCSTVKKAYSRLEREEQALREQTNWPFGDMFETNVGRFWEILQTRPYMRNRSGFVHHLLEQFGAVGGYVDAVETALYHLLDMLRLCGSDDLGVRYKIPLLQIRLGRDQEAYDFIKFFTKTWRDYHPLDDIELTFLDVKDADVLESPKGFWTDGYLDLSHTVAIVLIKLRILLDLRAIQAASRAFYGTLPEELIHLIRHQLVGSTLRSRRKLLTRGVDETSRLIEIIKGQVRQLYIAIDNFNPHLWPRMLQIPVDVERHTCFEDMFNSRTPEEARLAVSVHQEAWLETPGAVDLLRSLKRDLMKRCDVKVQMRDAEWVKEYMKKTYGIE